VDWKLASVMDSIVRLTSLLPGFKVMGILIIAKFLVLTVEAWLSFLDMAIN